jgi:hypothetical protein
MPGHLRFNFRSNFSVSGLLKSHIRHSSQKAASANFGSRKVALKYSFEFKDLVTLFKKISGSRKPQETLKAAPLPTKLDFLGGETFCK